MAVCRLSEWHRHCRKIVCVGRNYAEHAKELNNPLPSKPVLFYKPATAILHESTGRKIRSPPGCADLHHEIELGVVMKRRVEAGSAGVNWMDCIAGYVLALDMTARDLQNEAKKAGLPWLLAKGFDTSCPVSQAFIPSTAVPDPSVFHLSLHVNGQPRQSGALSDVIFDIPTLLEYICRYVTLEEADLVLTGTPSGVARVQSGDELVGKLWSADSQGIEMKFRVE